jgi:S1-C subfamily serine protease
VVIDRGLVVTAAHVVAGTDGIELIDGAGRSHTATVAVIDTNIDLALLRAPTLGSDPVRIRSLADGEYGTFVGYGDDDATPTPFTVGRAVVIDTEDIYVKGQHRRDGYEINLEVEPGDSGAGLVVGKDLGGIVWARIRDNDQLSYATDATEITKLKARLTTNDAAAVECA